MPIIYQFNKFPYHLNSRGWTVGRKAHTQVQVRTQTRAMFWEGNLAAHSKSPKKCL